MGKLQNFGGYKYDIASSVPYGIQPKFLYSNIFIYIT